jgi:hypothetical protein
MNPVTTALELAVPLLSFLAFTVAIGLLGNKYWPLMGFGATAVCFGLVLMVTVVQLSYTESILGALGPFVRKDVTMFRVIASAIGLFVFLGAAILFEKNYDKLEERLKSRQQVSVVQAPAGPTVEEIATAVANRLASAQPVADASKPERSGPITPSMHLLTAPTLNQRVLLRSAELLPKLTTLTAEGERIYKAVIGDAAQVEHFPQYQRQIEEWRTRVGNTYASELPNSGAREMVLPKTGVLGRGPIAFELSRLVNAIEEQRKVIGDLEKYVRRSLSFADESSKRRGVKTEKPQ